MVITLSYRQVREAIAHIAEDGWEPIGYTEDGEAQVAETSFVYPADREWPDRRPSERSRPTKDWGDILNDSAL